MCFSAVQNVGKSENFAASFLLNSSITCVYTFIVISALACPTSCWQTFTFTPLSAHRVINVCRSSCKWWFGHNVLKCRLACCAEYGNTRLPFIPRSSFCFFCPFKIVSTSSVKSMLRALVSVCLPELPDRKVRLTLRLRFRRKKNRYHSSFRPFSYRKNSRIPSNKVQQPKPLKLFVFSFYKHRLTLYLLGIATVNAVFITI